MCTSLRLPAFIVDDLLELTSVWGHTEMEGNECATAADGGLREHVALCYQQTDGEQRHNAHQQVFEQQRVQMIGFNLWDVCYKPLSTQWL